MSESYIKWVGGKGQIATELIKKFPAIPIDCYIEPFFGSGAMFFSYFKHTDHNNVFYEQPNNFNLSDTNKFLVNTHLQVRDNVEALCDCIRKFEAEYNEVGWKKIWEYYCGVRKLVTNDIELINNPLLSAARFIFINKTCFNGLWRVNSKGEFNVPHNKKWKITFNYDNIKKCSKILQSSNLFIREFDAIDDDELGERTFVYLDPPYVPVNSTSCFTSYTSKGFNMIEDLERIVKLCKRLDNAGVKWMMSNSDTPQVNIAFADWNIETIDVHRFIKAITKKDQTRDKVKEVVVTNY